MTPVEFVTFRIMAIKFKTDLGILLVIFHLSSSCLIAHGCLLFINNGDKTILEDFSIIDWYAVRFPTRCNSKFHSVEAATGVICHPLASCTKDTRLTVFTRSGIVVWCRPAQREIYCCARSATTCCVSRRIFIYLSAAWSSWRTHHKH